MSLLLSRKHHFVRPCAVGEGFTSPASPPIPCLPGIKKNRGEGAFHTFAAHSLKEAPGYFSG